MLQPLKVIEDLSSVNLPFIIFKLYFLYHTNAYLIFVNYTYLPT